MLALVLAIVATTTSTPARAAAPLATAEQLYEGAIARLAALRQGPYLSYEMDQTAYTRVNGILFDIGEKIVERRGDRAFHNVVMYGGTMMIGRHYLTPDEFIPNSGAPPALEGTVPMLDEPADTIKTIATVATSASYALTEVGDETIQDNFCVNAVHITLAPRRDSDVFNVRELWIRRSDFALCAAIFNSWSFSGTGHTRSVDAVWLDERGFIRNWRADMGGGELDAGSFKDVRWQETVPDGLFFSH